MKKLLVLTLIMGIASLASAGLETAATAQEGETITISLVAEAVTNGYTVRSIDDDVAGTAATGAETNFPGFNFAVITGAGKGDGGALYDGGTGDAFAGQNFVLIAGGSDAAIGEALMSFD